MLKKPRVTEETAQLLINEFLKTKDHETFLNDISIYSTRFGFNGGRRTRCLFIDEIIKLMKDCNIKMIVKKLKVKNGSKTC